MMRLRIKLPQMFPVHLVKSPPLSDPGSLSDASQSADGELLYHICTERKYTSHLHSCSLDFFVCHNLYVGKLFIRHTCIQVSKGVLTKLY